MIELNIHNISAPDMENPSVTERYGDGYTVRYFTFVNAVNNERDVVKVIFFDYSDKARREREDATYSWGAAL